MKKIKILLLTSVLFLLFGCTKCDVPPSDASASELKTAVPDTEVKEPEAEYLLGETITVNSSEAFSVEPDIAQITYSVKSSHSDAAQCQLQNSESVSQVIALLKSLNIQEHSIQTTDYYMNPVYNYNGSTPRLTGYQANTTLTVSDIPIEQLGEILSNSVSSGINSIQSVTYQTSSYDEGYQAALIQAIESARQKAQAMADAAGCILGPVSDITETSGYSDARYTDYSLVRGLAESSKQLATDTAFMTGEIDVKASVVVEYRLLKKN